MQHWYIIICSMHMYTSFKMCIIRSRCNRRSSSRLLTIQQPPTAPTQVARYYSLYSVRRKRSHQNFAPVCLFGVDASFACCCPNGWDPTAVINPFGGALEGCFRAYTETAGPMSQWPGLMLSTGTEACPLHSFHVACSTCMII